MPRRQPTPAPRYRIPSWLIALWPLRKRQPDRRAATELCGQPMPDGCEPNGTECANCQRNLYRGEQS